MAALRAAGASVRICPGITAASAVAAAAGISLSLRGLARHVQFVTAHSRSGEAQTWTATDINRFAPSSPAAVASASPSASSAGPSAMSCAIARRAPVSRSRHAVIGLASGLALAELLQLPAPIVTAGNT